MEKGHFILNEFYALVKISIQRRRLHRGILGISHIDYLSMDKFLELDPDNKVFT